MKLSGNHTRWISIVSSAATCLVVILASHQTVRAAGPAFVDSGQNLGNCRTFNLALGDLDGDNDLDLVTNCWFSGGRVLLNDGTGIFIDSGQSLGGIENHGIALGDLDNDGDLDALEVFNGSYDRVFLNSGLGNFTNSGQSLGGSTDAGLAVKLGDIDGDNDLDALISNFNLANKVHINDGSGVFTDSGQTIGDAQSRGMCLGDIDADGDLDIYLLNSSACDRVLLNNGNGLFSDSGQSLGSPTSYGSAKFADLDADGDLDVFLTNEAQGSRVLFNNGFGVFTDSGQILGQGQIKVCVVDLDNNGTIDAFTAHQGTGTEIWLNDGSGTFAAAAQSPAELNILAVDSGDVENDGDYDLIFGKLENTGGNKLYLNNAAEITSIGDDGKSSKRGMLRAFPNPANPRTVITFSLEAGEEIVLSVFDVRGRRISTLVDGVTSPGTHEVVWNGRGSNGMTVASGVYLIQLQTGRGFATSIVTIVR